MLFKSEHITQASGSIGGVTYAHNASGLYRRARAIPVNPNTGFQVQVRAAVTTLVTRWNDVLTAAQRNAWNAYAANVPVINNLGSSILISGQNWYIACNTPRIQALTKVAATIAIIDAAPVIFDRGDFTTPTFTMTVATGLSTAFTNTDAWAGAVEGGLLIYQGRPQNPSRSFFKGPWRLVGFVEGSVAPPTSPNAIGTATLALQGFVVSTGQRQWMAYAVTRADGRLSTRRIVGPNLVTAA